MKGFQSSRTNYVSLVRHKLKSKVKQETITREEHVFTVRILGFTSGDGKDGIFPLFVLFRALGIESDIEILSMIIYENDNQTLKNKLIPLIIPSVKDPQPIFSQKSAYKLLSLNTKGKEIFNVSDLLNNNLFPNYGNDNLSKAKYLGYTRKNIINLYWSFR